MSDSLDNNVDTQIEVTPPADAVVANTEEAGSPQTGQEDTELYVEAEVDQQTATNENANPSESELHARWVKEKEKRKRKNEELQREKDERERIERELNELKSTVGKLTKGAPPSLESCDYDEEAYQKATREYYSPAQPAVENKPETQPQNSQGNTVLDEAEFYLYQSEQELSKHLPDYEQNKSELVGKMKSQYNAPDNIMAQFANIAKQAGVDMAKSTVALNKNPSLLAELSQACTTGNQFAIADVLKKAAAKVQTRQRKPLDTQPEPTINSSGPIDNHSAAIKKALDKYAETGNVQDFRALQAAKKAANL